MTRTETRRTLITALALVAWTAFAGIYVNMSRFTINDTSCDGGELRPSTFGLVYLVVVAAVWMVPFVVLAVRSKSIVTRVLVVVAASVATGVVVTIATHVGEYCY